MTAVRSTFDYLFGLGIFGFLYWLLNGILIEVKPFSTTGDVYILANWLWTGAIVVYLIAGAYWLPRMMKEWRGGNKR